MSIIADGNLPHTGTIKTRQYVSTSGLGTSQTTVDKTVGLKCWVQMASMREIAEAEKLQKTVSHKVYFNSAFNNAIEEGDVLVMTASNTGNQDIVGKSFRYQVRVDGSAGCGVLFKYMFEEFQSPHVEGVDA